MTVNLSDAANATQVASFVAWLVVILWKRLKR